MIVVETFADAMFCVHLACGSSQPDNCPESIEATDERWKRRSLSVGGLMVFCFPVHLHAHAYAPRYTKICRTVTLAIIAHEPLVTSQYHITTLTSHFLEN